MVRFAGRSRSDGDSPDPSRDGCSGGVRTCVQHECNTPRHPAVYSPARRLSRRRVATLFSGSLAITALNVFLASSIDPTAS